MYSVYTHTKNPLSADVLICQSIDSRNLVNRFQQSKYTQIYPSLGSAALALNPMAKSITERSQVSKAVYKSREHHVGVAPQMPRTCVVGGELGRVASVCTLLHIWPLHTIFQLLVSKSPESQVSQAPEAWFRGRGMAEACRLQRK
jgi:hypothetical protein